MQSYIEIGSAETLANSLSEILNNDKSVMSCNSGTAFPTANLQIGMLCFRTDQNKLYELKDTTPTWYLLLDLSGASALVATATTAAQLGGVAAASYAQLASPTFTGAPSLPTGSIGVTQTVGNNTTALATTAFVASYAPLASPTFTGTPTLPTGTIGVTQAVADNTTKLATTAFVASYAPLASPIFTGTPSLPTGAAGVTQAVADNTTKLATTAFVIANLPSAFPTGTRMTFNQTSAPTGWTKDVTAALNDSIMRIVTGTVGSGGSTAFTTFNGQTATAAYTLAIADIPSHTHVQNTSISGATSTYNHSAPIGNAQMSASSTASLDSTAATGGGGGHSHGLTTSIKYNDFIIASKN